MPVYPYGGLYNRFGYPRRNDLVELPEMNPLPENKKTLETGDAGLDGYTVYSRASRYDGDRPISHATPQFEGPKLNED